MLYGMSWRQYWFGDPWMAADYREYYNLKRREKNEELYLQGAYFYNALQAVIGTAFGKRKIDYLKEPLDIYPKTKIEKEAEIKEERQKLIRYLTALKISADRKQQQGVDQDGNKP